MPYLLKNLMATRKDPVRRAKQKHPLLRRYKLRIGSKSLGPARKMKVSDSFYEANKKWIETYQELGALEVTALPGTPQAEAPAPVEEAKPAKTEDAPKKIEAREATPKLDAPEEKPAEAPAEKPAEDKKEAAPAEKPAAEKKAPAKRTRGRRKKTEDAE